MAKQARVTKTVEVQVDEGIPLDLGEQDLDPVARGGLKAVSKGKRPMSAENARRIMLDALPRAIVKRIEGLVPEGFELSKVELTFKVDGRPFGIGVGGEVNATFSPKGRRED
jgi:hypothetical protein